MARDQGFCFGERGDEAGTRVKVKGGWFLAEQSPPTFPNGGKQPLPTKTPKLLPPLRWGRGRLDLSPEAKCWIETVAEGA